MTLILHAESLIKAAPVEPLLARAKRNGMSYGLGPAGVDVRIAQDVTLLPFIRPFSLASTQESFDLPDDVMGFVYCKSTWARRGLYVFSTILEPGWTGFLTLELAALGLRPIKIKEGDPIAQIIFIRLEGATDRPYSGKYQGQGPEPVPARMEA